MPEAADSAAGDSRGILGQVEDFGQSALHTALESPVNGAIQFIDHAANIHLPEVNIIGAPTHDTIGAKAGAMVGAAADLVALSVVTGGAADILGGAGLAGGVATAAATGAIYGGILTPSDNNSKNFFEDRLVNGAIGAATFAAMGGAAKALGATGLFAMPEARSLAGSVTFGGLAGAAGGVVNAEATAVLKEDKALPSVTELATDVGTQALFGAAYGGLGYAYNHLNGAASRPTQIDSGKAKITTVDDANGQPVSFKATIPPRQIYYGDDANNAIWDATKMTDGSWKSSAYLVDKTTGQWADEAEVPNVKSAVTAPDGAVVVSDADGNVRTFSPSKYSRTNPEANAAAAASSDAAKYFDRTNPGGDREVSTPNDGYRRLDANGNTLEFANGAFGDNSASIKYDADGQMNSVFLRSGKGQPSVYLDRTGDNTWTFSKGDDQYAWKGSIDQIKDSSGLVKGLKLTPENGKPLVFDTTSGTAKIAAAVDNAGQYQDINSDLAWAKAGPDGKLTLNPQGSVHMTVNGKPTTGETVVKPGDNVHLQVDVGDNYAQWEDRPLKIGTTADGKPTINQRPITDKAVNLASISKPLKTK